MKRTSVDGPLFFNYFLVFQYLFIRFFISAHFYKFISDYSQLILRLNCVSVDYNYGVECQWNIKVQL